MQTKNGNVFTVFISNPGQGEESKGSFLDLESARRAAVNFKQSNPSKTVLVRDGSSSEVFRP